jgi:hypothetical protein
MSAEIEEQERAYLAALLDLTYPEAKDGTRVDLTAFQNIIAYHMVRCGWRMDISKRKIKARKVNARGVIEDAIEWIPIEMDDDPLANLSTMTMAEINALPPENPGWKVETSIRITDDPVEPNDGYDWTERSTAT